MHPSALYTRILMARTTRRSVLLLGAASLGAARDSAVDLAVEQDLPQLQFAAAEIRRALSLKRIPIRKNASTRIVTSVKAGGPEEQASARIAGLGGSLQEQAGGCDIAGG